MTNNKIVHKTLNAVVAIRAKIDLIGNRFLLKVDELSF